MTQNNTPTEKVYGSPEEDTLVAVALHGTATPQDASCPPFTRWLELAVSAEPLSRHPELARHLAACDRCRVYYLELFSELGEQRAGAETAAPDAVSASARAEKNVATSNSPGCAVRRGTRLPRWPLALAASLCLAWSASVWFRATPEFSENSFVLLTQLAAQTQTRGTTVSPHPPAGALLSDEWKAYNAGKWQARPEDDSGNGETASLPELWRKNGRPEATAWAENPYFALGRLTRLGERLCDGRIRLEPAAQTATAQLAGELQRAIPTPDVQTFLNALGQADVTCEQLEALIPAMEASLQAPPAP